MKRILVVLSLVLTVPATASAQVPNFSEDIAPIFYENCTYCHHTGGIAPMPLITYQDALGYSPFIHFMVSNDLMPPWPPDTTYQRYVHERIISVDEKNKILDWVNGGAPQGDSTLAPAPPVYTGGLALGPGDLQIQMAPYASQATQFADDYVCVVLGTGLTTNKKIRAIEVVPGNREILHHCLVYADTSGNYTPGQVINNCGGPPGAALIGGYVPGSGPIIFPNGVNIKMGMTLYQNASIILAMHYPEGSTGKADSTSVNFHFYPDTAQNVREVFSAPVLSNWSFCIDADSVQTVTSQFGPTFTSFSLLSIFPHMHLLGKSWLVYGLTPQLDTVNLCRINNWDFEWQGFYFFDYIKKLPILSNLHGIAVYDNTTSNPHNPNPVPQQICAGLNTTDEMHLVYFHFLPYQNGDELIRLDSLIVLPVSVQQLTGLPDDFSVSAWPNPSKDITHLEFAIREAAPVSLAIFDSGGKVVYRTSLGKRQPGTYRVSWDGRGYPGTLPGGLYFVQVTAGEKQEVTRVVRY